MKLVSRLSKVRARIWHTHIQTDATESIITPHSHVVISINVPILKCKQITLCIAVNIRKLFHVQQPGRLHRTYSNLFLYFSRHR